MTTAVQTGRTAAMVSAPAARPRRGRRTRVNMPGGILAILWLVVVLVPVYWVIIETFRPPGEGFAGVNPLVPPSNPTWANYAEAISAGMPRYFLNSVIVVTGAVLLILAVCLPAAYAITRNRWGFARSSFSLFLLGLAIPSQAAIIPIFFIINKMRLYDTLAAIILPSAAFAIPITVVILVNFMRDIPGELFESMRVDGAGNGRIMLSLVLPLARPALVTVAIYDGLNVWNGFLFPLVLTHSAATRVVPLGLWGFSFDLVLNIPAMMAAVVLSVLPILALYVLGRRHLLAGLTAGFGK